MIQHFSSVYFTLLGLSPCYELKIESLLKLAEIINAFDDSIWLIRKIDDSLEAQN